MVQRWTQAVLLSLVGVFGIISVASAQVSAQFEANYFSNTTLSGDPVLTRSESAIDYDWIAESPDPSVPIDNFSARWSGQLEFEEGSYRFSVTADDGARLIIDGTTVINQWIDQAPSTFLATVPLTAGPHTIVMEYYEKGGGAIAKLSWTKLVPETGYRVMPLGDSITHGWNVSGGYRTKLYELVTDLNFVGSQHDGPAALSDQDHEGYPGLKIDQIAGGVSGWLTAQTPEMILLKIGTNDMNAADWQTAPARMSNLLDQITLTRPEAEVIVASLIPLNNGNNSRVEQFNQALPGLIATQQANGKKVHFLNMYANLNTADLADGVHPNQGGYDKMAQSWAQAITTVRSGGSLPLPTPTPTPTPVTTPEPSEEYFVSEFYPNINLSGNPSVVRTDTTVNFDWGSGSPAPGISADMFSARFSKPQTFAAGAYKFTITGDDGVRLKVGDTLLINSWKDQAPTTYTANLTLAAGEYPIVFEFYERGGGATAKLSWEKLPDPTPTPLPTPTPTPDASGNFTTQLFPNTNLLGEPLVTRTDAAIQFDWGSGSPDPSIANDHFSVRSSRTSMFEAGLYTFTFRADDGVRLLLDGQVVLDRWIDQAPTSYSVTLPIQAGTHTVVIEYYEKGGGAVLEYSALRTGDIPAQVIIPSEGFLAEYFGNTQLAGVAALTQEVDAVQFDWGGGSPASEIPTDNFSARYRSKRIFEAGTYVFTLSGDDGIRLKLNDQVIIDAWKDQAPTTYTNQVVLSPGEYSIEVEYYEKGGGATVGLSWEKLL